MLEGSAVADSDGPALDRRSTLVLWHAEHNKKLQYTTYESLLMVQDVEDEPDRAVDRGFFFFSFSKAAGSQLYVE